MNFKILMVVVLAGVCAATAQAQARRAGAKRGAAAAVSATEAAQAKMDAKVKISQMAKIGPQSLIMAPNLQVAGSQPISKKQRRWGVFEMTYRTAAKWTESLTVNWYILADTTKATEIDRSKTAAKLPNYIYYTATSRYLNIPEGDHRSGMCLPPSFIERYGEPVVISCEIVTDDGKTLDGETVVNGVQGFVPGKFTQEEEIKKWWNNDKIMNAKNKAGDALIEIRQGLMDRSKSPFALVNSADYEVVQ